MRRRTLREWRAYRDLSKSEIAEKLGVTVLTYSTYEKHPEKMRIKDAAVLADLFGCEIQDIIFFENQPN